METAITQLLEQMNDLKKMFLECDNEEAAKVVQACINMAKDKIDTERVQIERAYIGYYSPTISDEDFDNLMTEAKRYFEWQYKNKKS